MSIQLKLDFIHDTRQAFGRSTLVLQGGAIFGLCHLGVVKALFLRGLLPRIITGTATGALIAALSLDPRGGRAAKRPVRRRDRPLSPFPARDRTIPARGADNRSGRGGRLWCGGVQRFRKDGYFLDVKVLEECAGQCRGSFLSRRRISAASGF